MSYLGSNITGIFRSMIDPETNRLLFKGTDEFVKLEVAIVKA